MFLSLSKRDTIKIMVTISVLFVIMHFIRITLLINGEETTFFDQVVWQKMILPASLSEWIHQPWTLLTYMFVEMNFMQIVGNMIWLWIFGMVIEDLKGEYHILPLFILGGMVSGLFLWLGHFILPTHPSFFYGGSLPAVTAVVVGACLFRPTYIIWQLGSFQLRLWQLGLAFVVFVLASFARLSFLHAFLVLGGIVSGVLYNYGLQSFFLNCAHQYAKLSNYFWNNENYVLRQKSNSLNQRFTVKTFTKKSDEETLNVLLEKIHQSGMNSLSQKEKQQLEQLSQAKK